MSLFGTSPDAPARNTSSALFDDEPSAKPKSASSGLFADSADDTGDSPWSSFTPKKQARGDLVKSLLPASDVPDSYIDAYDHLLESDPAGSGVSSTGVARLLQGVGLGQRDQERILDIVAPGGPTPTKSFGRGEFNVLLALIGLAQEKEEVSLDSVDERKQTLPRPKLPNLQPQRQPQTSEDQQPPRTPTKRATPAMSAARKPSFNEPDTDPWASPANTRTTPASNGFANGASSARPEPGTTRTTSAFSTSAEHESSTNVSKQSSDAPSVGGEDWDTFTARNTGGYGDDDLTGDGFGGGAGAPGQPTRKPITSRRNVSQGAEEILTVTALPEKEGMFLFQYRNYEISSNRRSTKVIRRFSDFVWLLDCLHKRYPFRQLPLLPPKRVSINGNHIAADNLFIEKRRRGLARFANALIRHPVLREEQLVSMFLTVPTELAAWRKQAALTITEEFTGRALSPTLEDSLPPTLDDLFNTVRAGARRAADLYIVHCSLLERLIKRKEGIAGEYTRLAANLSSLTETTADSYAIDANEVPLLNSGLSATARHLSTHAALLGDDAAATDTGVLEDAKRQRDACVSLRDMFDRRDRLARDNIPTLEKRIAGNEAKLSAVRGKPAGTQKPGEAEKLEDAITRDKEGIVAQHARGVFIRECVRDEIAVFQQSALGFQGRWMQEWAGELSRFSEAVGDNWKGLVGETDSMPGAVS